jgi:hypothetical protein
MKGYPISSFLFWDLAPENKSNWEIYKFAENFKFGELHNEIAETDGRDVTLVLDGQQRLTSLLLGLRGTYTIKTKNKRWQDTEAWQRKRLYLDLLTDPGREEKDRNEDEAESVYAFAFHEKQPSSVHGKLWMKVGEVLNYPNEDAFDRFKETLIDLLPQDATRNAERTVRRNLDRLYRMIWKDEIICSFTERDQDYDRVLGIFVRANDAGTKLSKSDLMLSVITSKWSDISAREEIYSFVEMLNSRLDRRNNVSKDFVMKSCLLLSDLDHVYQIKNFTNRNLEIMRGNWTAIKLALKRTFALINRLGIDRENLTSVNALMPIAYYLRKIDNDISEGTTPFHTENTERIRRWLMASLLNNVFGGQSDQTLGVARKTIVESLRIDQDFPLLALNESLSKQIKRTASFSSETITNILSSKYGSKPIFFILSLLYDEKNWGTTQYQIDHIFPRSKINRNSLLNTNMPASIVEQIIEASERVGNLQLISAKDNQSKNGHAFDSWITSRDDDFVNRHLIPPDRELWDIRRLPDFVLERERLIRRKLLSLG